MTEFYAEGRSVYVRTPSGKRLCVAAHTDWFSVDWIVAALQAAHDRDRTQPVEPVPASEYGDELPG